MTYLNQFHKEAVERKLRKIAESMKSPMNSVDAANYMKRNFRDNRGVVNHQDLLSNAWGTIC